MTKPTHNAVNRVAFLRYYSATCGCHVRLGARQSMPSSNTLRSIVRRHAAFGHRVTGLSWLLACWLKAYLGCTGMDARLVFRRHSAFGHRVTGFSRLLACRPKASNHLRKALRALLVTDKKMPTFQWAFWFGGDEGIRTLDTAQHRILP